MLVINSASKKSFLVLRCSLQTVIIPAKFPIVPIIRNMGKVNLVNQIHPQGLCMFRSCLINPQSSTTVYNIELFEAGCSETVLLMLNRILASVTSMMASILQRFNWSATMQCNYVQFK